MAKRENSPSPPKILKETAKLLDSVEKNEDKISISKIFLKQKKAYLEELQVYYGDLIKSRYRKQASLAVINDRASLIDTQQIIKYRNRGKEIHDSNFKSCQTINNIEATFLECEEKISVMEKNLKFETQRYEMKIDHLTKLLSELTGKREKELNDLKAQKEKMLNENFDFKHQLMALDNQEEFGESDDSNDLQELEREVEDLGQKLSVLDEDFTKLQQEKAWCEATKEETDNRFHESVLKEVDIKAAKITEDISQVAQDMENEKAAAQEKDATYQTLEEYKNHLDKEFSEAVKLWKQLEKPDFSKLNQIIDGIKEDIVGRSEKCNHLDHENLGVFEEMKKKDAEIEEVNSATEELHAELKEIDQRLCFLTATNDYDQQQDHIFSKSNDLDNNISELEMNILTKKEEIREYVNRLNKETEMSNLEIMNIENRNWLEIKELEGKNAIALSARNKLESNVESTNTQIKQLEDELKGHQDASSLLTNKCAEQEERITEAQKKLKLFKTKKEEMIKDQLDLDTANEGFMKPKTVGAPKKVLKNIAKPKEKRNWDSDSSLDEEIKLCDVLKRKQKRKQSLAK